MAVLYNNNNMEEIYRRMINQIKYQIENPALRDSTFVFDTVLHMDIDFHRYNPIRGSSYIKLPSWLSSRKAIISPKNEDSYCFKWAVIAALKWKDLDCHPEKVSKLRNYEGLLDWSGIRFPTPVKDIGMFEDNNGIGVNVLGIEDKRVYILRKSSDYKITINLMLISELNRKHYVVVKSLSKLLASSNSKNKGEQHFCKNCLHGFKTEASMVKHYGYCGNNDSVKIEMPKQTIVKYSSGQFEFKVPFIMYADFESLLAPIEGASGNPNISSTRRITDHVPCGWCVYSKAEYGDSNIEQYRGEDCVKRFCEHIISEAKRFYKPDPLPMKPLTSDENRRHKSAKVCHICKEPFMDDKVRDHCHFTGLYRGAARSQCNIRYKVPGYIPVVFHNLSGYDAHLFIKQLSQYTDDIKVIAKNTESYISFSIKVEVRRWMEGEKHMELRFIDSAKFMNSSLDSLVNNLRDGGHKFFGVRYSKNKKELLVKKGIYPYKFMDGWDKMEYDRLPTKDKFYGNLNMKGVSDEDYEHACKVWKTFSIANMGEYHDLYLRTDTVLLADVFESFRKVCMYVCMHTFTQLLG